MLHLFEKRWHSPNFNERADGARPSLIILHYTGMRTAREALERLCDPQSQVSAHYLVDENGRVRALVPEKHRAWHAGASFWRGTRDLNSHSIGIEIVNPGHEFGYRPFPERQIAAVSRLCRGIMTRHGIPPAGVLAHSDIAPARKQDPGELFPWERLAAQGIGLWPAPNAEDQARGAALATDPAAFHAALLRLGYDPEESAENVIRAFHRRFCPEAFGSGPDPALPRLESGARLAALEAGRVAFKI